MEHGSERALGPLSGFRVLDLTSVVVGPYCTMALGDMGADIVKIEAPGGDNLRDIGPRRHPGMAANFLNINRNKRSLVLDLKTEVGKSTLLRLAKDADVLVHNMRREAIERLGLTFATVAEVNPSIVYCGIQGYGRRGPYKDKAAYDDTIQGASGMAAVQQRPGDDQPRYVVGAIGDKTPAMVATSAILAALLHRERTGAGQEIEVPMFETMTAYVMNEHMYGATFEPPLGTTVYPRQVSPFRRPYRTSDGYICTIMYTDRQWLKFFELADRPDLALDERFRTIGTRTDNIDALYSVVSEVLAKRSSSEWLAMFEAADLPAMPLNTPDQVFEDAHLGAIGFFAVSEHPTEGPVRTIGHPVSFSGFPDLPRRHAPVLGEHGREVLLEAGFAAAEIDALVGNRGGTGPMRGQA